MGSRDRTAFEELLARGRERGDDPAGAGPDSNAGMAGAGAGASEGAVRVALGGLLWHAFGRPGQAGTSWWFASGVELELGDGQSWRPDLVGFRRRRGEAATPSGQPIRARPDWVCEIVVPAGAVPGLGPSAGAVDDSACAALAQLRHPRRVPHLWLADAAGRVMRVYRWTAPGYEPVATAAAGTSIRAAPFDGIPIAVDDIFYAP
jgi:hypothetical protein